MSKELQNHSSYCSTVELLNTEQWQMTNKIQSVKTSHIYLHTRISIKIWASVSGHTKNEESVTQSEGLKGVMEPDQSECNCTLHETSWNTEQIFCTFLCSHKSFLSELKQPCFRPGTQSFWYISWLMKTTTFHLYLIVLDAALAATDALTFIRTNTQVNLHHNTTKCSDQYSV
jgi:hypothetical protein